MANPPPRSFLKNWDWEKTHWPWEEGHKAGEAPAKHHLCWQQVRNTQPAGQGAPFPLQPPSSLDKPLEHVLPGLCWGSCCTQPSSPEARLQFGVGRGAWQSLLLPPRHCQLGHCASCLSLPQPGMLQTCGTVNLWVSLPHYSPICHWDVLGEAAGFVGKKTPNPACSLRAQHGAFILVFPPNTCSNEHAYFGAEK